MKLCLALLCALLVCVSAAIEKETLDKTVQNELETIDLNDIQKIEDFYRHDNLVFKDLPVEDDLEEDGDDGISENVPDLKKLSPEEFKDYLLSDEQDFRQVFELKGHRVKRWLGAALRVGRVLASRFTRTGITRSGSRLTKHYAGRGNYRTAVQDFQRMNPRGARPITGSRYQGQTGTVGNHRVTVRSGSSQGSPTMEIRSPSGTVRKFRYND